MTAAALPSHASTDRRFLVALYLLALLSSAVFCVLHESPSPLIVAAAGGIIAWFVVDSRGKPLPKWVINTFLVLVSGNFFYEAWFSDNFNLMTSLGHFIVGLLMCKFFERKTPRDVTQILILSLLIVVASTMYSSSISFALVLVIYFAALVYTVILLNLRVQARAVTARAPIPSLLVHNGEHHRFTADLRRSAFRSILILVPVALLVFLTMPRTGGSSLLGRWTASGSFQTGFTDQVQFQDYGQLNQSDAPAMEVTFTQGNINVGAEIIDPYFRGTTLEVYEPHARQWSHDRDDAVRIMNLSNEGSANLVAADRIADTPMLVQTYVLPSRTRGVLFHISPAMRISSESKDRPLRRIAYSPVTGVLFPSNEGGGTSSYTIESLPRFDPSMMDPPGPNYASTSAPPDPEIVRLARNIAADLLPPDAAAAPDVEKIPQIAGRFESYLRTNYPYSLEFNRIDIKIEPITDFLLNHKEVGGHCEYFAASMVMLCRSVHIPARMVTGYHGGEYNSLSGGFLVKQKNAHAWAEYFLPRTGWIQSDPSPISVTTIYSQSLLSRWSKEITQIVQNLWLSAVVTFDNESRGAVVNWIVSSISSLSLTVVDALTSFASTVSFAVRAEGENGQTDLRMRLSFLGSIIGMALVLGYLFRKWRREYRVRARYGAHRHPVRMSGDAVFLDELLRLVERKSSANHASAPRRPEQTPQEYIEAHASTLGSAAEDARWLISTFYGLQFGATTLTSSTRTQIARALRHVRETLRAPAPPASPAR